MRKNRPWIKWVAIAVSAVLTVVMLVASIHVSRERRKNRENWQEVSDAYSEKMRPLWEEKRSIERELTGLEDEEAELQLQAISAVILCTEPDARIMDDIYPKMEKQGYAGLIALAENRFPGDEGCMTISDLRTLLRRGWEICITVEEGTDVAALCDRVINAGLPNPVAAYYPNGGYNHTVKDTLAAVDIDKVVVYGEVKAKLKDIWCLPAYGSYEHDSKRVFMESVEDGTGVAMTVSYADERGKYDKGNFEAMLDTIVMFSEEGYVFLRNFSEAYDFYQKYDEAMDDDSTFANRRNVLEDRLEEIEAEITASAK